MAEEKIKNPAEERFPSKKIGFLENALLKISYPILGSLSSNIQYRVCKKVGENNYNPRHAALASMLAETFLAFPLTWSILDGSPYQRMAALFALDASLRAVPFFMGNWSSVPSIAGKILSLPVDIYDKIKKKNFYSPQLQKQLKDEVKGQPSPYYEFFEAN